MKKLFVLVPAMLLCLTGCFDRVVKKESEKKELSKELTVKCTLSSKDVINGYSLKSTYNINYKDDLVESVDSVEEVTSENDEVLDTFESELKELYNTMDETYGGYDVKITKNGNKVTSKVTIDYNEMDLAQLIKDQPNLKKYSKDGKLKVDGIKSMYENMGATCE